METKRKLKRRRKLSVYEDAVHVGRKRAAAKLSLVQSAEHNSRPGKNQVTVCQQKFKRGGHDGDGDVDFLVCIFFAQEVSQQRLVRVWAKSRQIHCLAINLNRLAGIGPKGVDQFGL